MKEIRQHVETLRNSKCPDEQIARLTIDQLEALISQCEVEMIATETILNKLCARAKEL